MTDLMGEAFTCLEANLEVAKDTAHMWIMSTEKCSKSNYLCSQALRNEWTSERTSIYSNRRANHLAHREKERVHWIHWSLKSLARSIQKPFIQCYFEKRHTQYLFIALALAIGDFDLLYAINLSLLRACMCVFGLWNSTLGDNNH